MVVIPTTFEGFHNLKVLKLSLRMDSSLERLISKCPLLERLSLCAVFNHGLNVSITISAPKMKYLSLEGYFKDICLKKSPLLVEMRLLLLYGDQGYGYCDLFKILGGAPNLEKLKVTVECFERGCYLGGLPTTFGYLKVMRLFDFKLGESKAVAAILKLLTSAPNLEQLVIYNSAVIRGVLPNKIDSNFWKKECVAGHYFMKLKVVEMGYILCIAPEIEFAEVILSNSPILEKMTIRTRERKQAVITRMLKILPTLPRASAQVAVTFHDGYSQWSPNIA